MAPPHKKRNKFNLLVSTRLLILHFNLKEEPVLFKSEQYVYAKLSFFYSFPVYLFLYCCFLLFSWCHICCSWKRMHIYSQQSLILFQLQSTIWGFIMTMAFLASFFAPLSPNRTLTASFSRLYWKYLRNWVLFPPTTPVHSHIANRGRQEFEARPIWHN